MLKNYKKLKVDDEVYYFHYYRQDSFYLFKVKATKKHEEWKDHFYFDSTQKVVDTFTNSGELRKAPIHATFKYLYDTLEDAIKDILENTNVTPRIFIECMFKA
jgi:hypothetical protein